MTSDEIIQEATRILKQQGHALLDCAERLQRENAEAYHKAVCHLFRACEAGGKIIVTGIGKSGKVCEKLVATLQSTGNCAVFLHPSEALHGDLGMVSPQDAVIAISYSGNTDELLRLLPSLRSRGCPIIALCGKKHSRLVKEADIWLDSYVKDESCWYIPTTSTTVAMAIGDSIAITLMRLRGFTTEYFALNHPAGTLGRKLLMQVKDVMHHVSEVLRVEESTPMDQVMCEATRFKCGIIIVMDKISKEKCNKGQVIGILTKEHIRRALQEYRAKIFQLCARDLMSRDILSCLPNDMAFEVKRLLEDSDEDDVRGLPVFDNANQLIGVVLLEDLVELL